MPLVHSIAGKAVILNKTGGAAIGIGIRRVLGDGGLIDSKNLIVIDGLHISRVVQHGRKEADFIGQFGGLVAVAGASPVNGLHRHGSSPAWALSNASTLSASWTISS